MIAAAALCAAAQQTSPLDSMTTAKWREDLAVYREQMPATHGNLFHTMSREQFDHSLDQLEQELPHLSSNQIKVEILRLVAMVNDGHTRVRPDTLGNHMLPIRLHFFADGLYVESADKPYAALVGGKVTRIGQMTAEQAYMAVRPLVPVDRDNEFRRKFMAPDLLVTPEVLQGLGIADRADAVEVTIVKNAHETKTTLPAGPFRLQNNHGRTPDPPGWITAHDSSTNPLPLYLQHTDRNYWNEFLPGGKTLYIQYNEVHDSPEGEPIAQFFPRVFAEAEQRKIERVVLDMRFNGGGNNELNRPIWHAIIKNDRLNQPGKLWVIIGPKTFSAAMNCVDDLEMNTHAVFAGEPTGETPNMWGDPAPVTLPNSGIVIQASTLWWQMQDPRDTRDFRGPDLAAELTFADFANNIDPVMKAIEQAGDMESLPDRLRKLAEAGRIERITPVAQSYLADPRFRWASFENPLNLLGYQLMGAGKLQAAIDVLTVNTERYPESWNAWDSLGEAYMKAGNKAEAICHYRKSLALNPRNTGARDAIARMQAAK